VSDSSEFTDTLADELSEQIDVGGLVTGDDVSDQVDPESLGRSLGEVAGAALGRRVGRRVSRWLVSKVPFADPGGDESSSLAGTVAGALFVALRRTFSKPEFREPVVDALRSVTTDWRGRLEEVQTETAAAAGAGAEAAKEAVDEATDEAKATAEEAADAAAAVGDADELDPEQLQTLREGTYRELLEMMEYSQLQSLAKKVDVKANTARDQMIDDIVEQFNSETGEEADGS